jgi:hypothetical protein
VLIGKLYDISYINQVFVYQRDARTNWSMFLESGIKGLGWPEERRSPTTASVLLHP